MFSLKRKLATQGFALTILLSTMFPSIAADSYAQGELLYVQKKYPQALAAFRAAQSEKVHAAEAMYYEGLCYHQLGKMQEAKTAYMNLVNNYPRSKVARQALSTLAKLDPSIGLLIQEKTKELQVGTKRDKYASLPDKASFMYAKDVRSGHMLLKANFDGQLTTVMFDTGAGVTTCRQSLLDKLGVKPRWTGQGARMSGVGGEVSAKVAMISVNAGNLTRVLPVYVEQDAGRAPPKEAVLELPLIGQDFLDGYSYEIDDARGIVNLHKAAPKGKTTARSSRDSNEVQFWRDGSHIVVRPKVNGRECEMYLDTGAGSVAFADRHLAMCGLNVPTSARRSTGGGVGGTRQSYNFVIESIELGPVTRKSVVATVLVNSSFPKPLLGQTFLQGLKYEIDSNRNVIRFTGGF